MIDSINKHIKVLLTVTNHSGLERQFFRSDDRSRIICFLLCRLGQHWVALSRVLPSPLHWWAPNWFCPQIFELCQSDVGEDSMRFWRTICRKRIWISSLWYYTRTRPCRATDVRQSLWSITVVTNTWLQHLPEGEEWTSYWLYLNRFNHWYASAYDVADAGELGLGPKTMISTEASLFLHDIKIAGNDMHVLSIDMIW